MEFLTNDKTGFLIRAVNEELLEMGVYDTPLQRVFEYVDLFFEMYLDRQIDENIIKNFLEGMVFANANNS